MRTEPDADPFLAAVLVEDWAAADAAAGPKPTALGTRLRYSSFGRCAQEIAFNALEVPPSDPPDLSATWVMRLGSIIHEHFQAAIQHRFPGAEVEAVLGVDEVSGSADVLLRLPDGERVVAELKSLGASQFDWMMGYDRGTWGRPPKRKGAKGPKEPHVLQAGGYADAAGVDTIIICYLCLEPVPRHKAERMGLSDHERFVAQWTLGREDWGPLVEQEKARQHQILELVDGGDMPGRWQPGVGLIADPEQLVADAREGHGAGWPCLWCPHYQNCLSVRSDATVAEVVEFLGTKGAVA